MDNSRKQLDSLLIKPAGPDCNMACTYCFYLDKKELFSNTEIHRMSEIILEETIRQTMIQAGENISFCWQGGEPTLMGLTFFEKAIEFQKRYGSDQTIGNGFQTNGILIDKQWTQFLNTYNFLVGLSLDGLEHIHDRYRRMRGGRGSWSRVVESTKRMLDAGVAINTLTVVNDYSVKYPQEIYEFHKDLGVTHMQFIPCLEPNSSDSTQPASYSVSAEKYGNFLSVLFNLWMADFEEGTPTTFIRYFDSLFYRYVDLNPPDCTLLPACGVYVVVEHNGDVYSCDFFVESDWKLGNVMQKNLTVMLNSKRQYEFGRMKADLSKVCKKCEWVEFCRGGCTKDRNRNPYDNTLNYFCRSYKLFFEHAHAKLLQLAEVWKRQQEDVLNQEKPMKSRNRSKMKVGRNDPCPCGSGIKVKKCCGILL